MPTGWIFSTTGKARIPASCIRRKWRLTCGPDQYVVTPLVADQELEHPWQSPKYWEGAASVSGSDGQTIGRAYVELAGYKAR